MSTESLGSYTIKGIFIAYKSYSHSERKKFAVVRSDGELALKEGGLQAQHEIITPLLSDIDRLRKNKSFFSTEFNNLINSAYKEVSIYHQKNPSYRWDIVLSPWAILLWEQCVYVYSLVNAFESIGIQEVLVEDIVQPEILSDYSEFAAKSKTYQWMTWLLLIALRQRSPNIQIRRIPHSSTHDSTITPGGKKRLEQKNQNRPRRKIEIIKSLLSRWIQAYTLKTQKKIVLETKNPDLLAKAKHCFGSSLRQIFTQKTRLSLFIDLAFRREMKLNYKSITSGDKFASFYFEIFWSFIPSVYLEAFDINRKQLSRVINSRVSHLVTSYSHITVDLLKIWVAEMKERPKEFQLEVVPHGLTGILGSEWSLTGKHEAAACDIYRSWGLFVPFRAKSVQPGDINLYRKFCLDYFRVHWRRNSRLDIIMFMSPPPLYWRSVQGLDSYCNKYTRTAKTLEQITTSHSITYRPYGDKQVKKFQEFLIRKSLSDSDACRMDLKDFSRYRIVSSFSLAIFDYWSTGFLELLSIDFPCIILLENEFRINDDIKNLVEKLVYWKIVHRSVSGMKDFLDSYGESISEWWKSEELIRIKKETTSLLCCANPR